MVIVVNLLVLICSITILVILVKGGRKVMVDLSKLQADVAAQSTVVASAEALIKGLADRIRATAGDQAAVDALATQVEQDSQGLADAVQANTV